MAVKAYTLITQSLHRQRNGVWWWAIGNATLDIILALYFGSLALRFAGFDDAVRYVFGGNWFDFLRFMMILALIVAAPMAHVFAVWAFKSEYRYVTGGEESRRAGLEEVEDFLIPTHPEDRS